MLLVNPLPWKLIFHAIYPEPSIALQEVALMVKNIWFKIYEQLQIRCGGLSGLSRRDILLGIENVDYLYINSILLITKYYIYSCK
jgi:hypothetical protein